MTKVPQGMPAAIMRLRMKGKSYKDMAPLLKKQFAADIKELDKRNIQLNFSADGIKSMMKNHTKDISSSDPELLEKYREQYSNQFHGDLGNQKTRDEFNLLCLKLIADEVPEVEWENKIKEKFPVLKDKPSSWKPCNVHIAAKKCPKKGNETLWARRDAVTKQHYQNDDYKRARTEGRQAYEQKVRGIRIKRRLNGDDASRDACNEEWHAERRAQIQRDREAGVFDKPYKLNSERSAEKRKELGVVKNATAKKKRAQKKLATVAEQNEVPASSEEAMDVADV